MKKRALSLFLACIMALSLAFPALAADYTYDVQGGKLKFDPTTGTITDCDNSVYYAEIPSTIYDIPVTTIGKRAFAYCNKLTSVVIPPSVTEIGVGAFSACSSLASVTIPDSVTTMAGDYGSVFGLTKLESVIIPGSIKKLSHIFGSCNELTTITLNEGLEEIGEYFVHDCPALEEITIPDSVKTISDDAFFNCENISTVTIGSGVKSIDSVAFSLCPNLTTIYFRGNAPAMSGKLVSSADDKSVPPIIYYPEGASGWTSPTWNGYITKSYKLPGSETTTTPETPSQPADPGTPSTPSTPAVEKVTATPYNSTVIVNGQEVTFDAYNIKNNNYFKLRDLAFILSGSNVQFNVTWDDSLRAINMMSNAAYTPVGGEMSGKGGVNQIGTQNSAKIYLDGREVDLTAYTIKGNNYFKLRDVGALFNFSVEWDRANSRIVIDTSLPYADV